MHNVSASLAALIGSRICHDLINPIGAISNGLELVAMGAPDPASPEMMLIQQSCDNAAARIQFFRIAFGSGDDVRPVPVATARSTLIRHYTGTRIRPEWNLDLDVGRNIVQLGFLAALCLETALPQGGDISVTLADRRLTASGTGPMVKRDNALWSLLEGDAIVPPPSVRPAHVQFVLLAQLCADSSRSVASAFDTGQARLEIPLSGKDR